MDGLDAKTQRLRAAAQVVQRLGGASKVGRWCRVSPQAVATWLKRGGIPSEHVPRLVHMSQSVTPPVNLTPAEIRPDVEWHWLKGVV
jgi:DNA-binding transcriptional regulator YdaS (Cro superfamily)